MKMVKFQRDVYWGYTTKKHGGRFTPNPNEPDMTGLRVMHKAGSEHHCSELYYSDLADGGVQMEITAEIPDEKFKRFVEIYGEKLRADGLPGKKHRTELLAEAAVQTDREWADKDAQ